MSYLWLSRSFRLRQKDFWAPWGRETMELVSDCFYHFGPEGPKWSLQGANVVARQSAGPKHGCLNVGAWKRQESANFLQRSLFNVAVQFFACCSAASGKMTSGLQKSKCWSATSAAQLSENCSATSVSACGMLHRWGLEGWGLGLTETRLFGHGHAHDVVQLCGASGRSPSERHVHTPWDYSTVRLPHSVTALSCVRIIGEGGIGKGVFACFQFCDNFATSLRTLPQMHQTNYRQFCANLARNLRQICATPPDERSLELEISDCLCGSISRDIGILSLQYLMTSHTFNGMLALP